MAYKRCPRCELNYILAELELCDICKAELNLGGIELLPDSIEEEFEVEQRVCSVCNEHYIVDGSLICDFCKAKKTSAKDIELEVEDDWKEDDIVEEVEDSKIVSLNQLVEDEINADPEDEN